MIEYLTTWNVAKFNDILDELWHTTFAFYFSTIPSCQLFWQGVSPVFKNTYMTHQILIPFILMESLPGYK